MRNRRPQTLTPLGTPQVADTDTQFQQALRIRRFLIALASYALAIAVMGLGTGFGIWGVDVLVSYTVPGGLHQPGLLSGAALGLES